MDKEPLINVNGAVGVIISGNLLFAIILCIAIAYYNESAIAGIIVGGVYYLFSNNMSLLTITGETSRMFAAWQEQRTLRLRDKQEFKILALREAPRRPSAKPLPEPAPARQLVEAAESLNYVPAAEETVKRDALLWAISLYGPDGQPNPEKIHMKSEREQPGRLRIKSPGPQEREYLLTRRVLKKVQGGYRLVLEHYPTVNEVRKLNLRG